MKMKTKHKLKAFKYIAKGFQEYEDLRKSLFFRYNNTTEIQKVLGNLKPSPSQTIERF